MDVHQNPDFCTLVICIFDGPPLKFAGQSPNFYRKIHEKPQNFLKNLIFLCKNGFSMYFLKHQYNIVQGTGCGGNRFALPHYTM